MSPDQIQHREQIILDYSNSYRAIYDAGAIEHGGLMTDLSVERLAKESLNEAQDSYAYNHTLLTNLDRVRTRLQQLKDTLEKRLPVYSADLNLKIAKEYRPTWENSQYTVGELEELYDPIRRINAIIEILYGER